MGGVNEYFVCAGSGLKLNVLNNDANCIMACFVGNGKRCCLWTFMQLM